MNDTWTAERLPFNTFRFVRNEQAIEIQLDAARVTCALTDYNCTRVNRTTPEGALRGVNGPVRGPHVAPVETPNRSPDGKLEAFVQNFNIAVRDLATQKVVHLSTDGSEGNFYEIGSVAWSPDSKKLAVYRVRPGYRRTVHYVESSPEDQLQPRHWTLQYAKPGDQLDLEQPVLFHLDPVARIDVTNELFPNPYELSDLDVAEGWSCVDFRIQPARPSGLPDHRGRCRLGTDPPRALGGAQNVLLLQRRQRHPFVRQALSARSRGRPASHLDVRTRWLEPSLPD